MEEKKLTIDEIIKGLDNLSYYHDEKCVHEFLRGAIALIQDQKAEIERLTEEIKSIKKLTTEQVAESEKLKQSCAEAVNSFIRLETLYKVKCQELEIENKKLEDLKGGKID